MKLPDGRVQITSYQADDYGYRPHITYAYDGNDPLPVVKKPHFVPGDVHQSPEIFTPSESYSPPPPEPAYVGPGQKIKTAFHFSLKS